MAGSENSRDTTSSTLLLQLRDNDSEAWKTFVRLYTPLVDRWIRPAIRTEDVPDVVQEVFSAVNSKLDSFDAGRKDSGAFRSWLWGIARHKKLDHLRKLAAQPQASGGEQALAALQQLEATAEEPESIDGATPQQILLQSAIDTIQDEVESRTFSAFYRMTFQRETASQIGADLGMTARAVRQAKFRVSRRLRMLLEGDLPETVLRD